MNKKNIFGIIAISLIIPLIVGGIFLNKEKLFVEGEKKEFGPEYEIKDFTTTLSNSNKYQAVKSNVIFTVTNKKVIEEIEDKRPKIDDKIIFIFKKQPTDNLEESNTKTIKDKIRKEINNFLYTGQIKRVFFKEYVLQ